MRYYHCAAALTSIVDAGFTSDQSNHSSGVDITTVEMCYAASSPRNIQATTEVSRPGSGVWCGVDTSAHGPRSDDAGASKPRLSS